MNEGEIVQFASTALVLVLALSMPPIIVAAVVGTLVSLLQALTQIQEQTLSFGIKLVAVAATIALIAPWLGAELQQYTLSLFEAFPYITR